MANRSCYADDGVNDDDMEVFAQHAKGQLSITQACAPETRMSMDQLKDNADRHDVHDDDHDDDQGDDHDHDVRYDDPGQIVACSEYIVYFFPLPI